MHIIFLRHSMRKVLYYFLILPLFVSAQINESDTLKVKASLSLTGFFQGGNVETVIFRAKTDVSFNPKKNWVFKNQNSYVYQEFGKNKADEDILSLNFLYFHPDRKIYPFALGFASTNYRREIDYRYLIGAGVSIKILKKEGDLLNLSLSSEHEQTRFSKTDFNYTAYNGSQSINTLRGTVWINGRYSLVKEKMILTHESYVQPSLKQANNYKWQADVGLEFSVWKHLNFKTNYRHTFESIVIENQKQQDQFLTFGFVVKSY